MTMCSIYVGSLENFNWEVNWNGNLPAAVTRAFPPYRGSYTEPYHDWVSRAGVFCKQTDFDGHVARVSKAQILDFIDFCYGTDPKYTDPQAIATQCEHAKWLSDIKEDVAALDDDRLYGLVGECF